MTPMKKLAAGVLALLFCLAALPAAGGAARADGNNLLANGTFEQHDGKTPDGWQSDCWDNEEGFSLFSVDPNGGTDGGAVAVVENAELNDARFQQKVPVQKGKLYRLSGDIKVENASGGWGATLSFKDTYTYTTPLLDTGGQWQHVELYGRTGDNQKEVTVFIRLGGYGNLSSGRAWFDNVVLEQVDSLPSGLEPGTMATFTPAASSSNGNAGKNFLTEIILIALLFSAVLLWAFKHMGDTGGLFSGPANRWLYLIGILVTGNLLPLLRYFNDQYDWKIHLIMAVGVGLAPALILVWIKRYFNSRDRRWIDVAYLGFVALAVRAILAMTIKGYPNDIACWLGWSGQAATNLFGMYKGEGFLDYPPGYMYVLFFVGKINGLLSMIPKEELLWLSVKMPSIIADLVTSWFIWKIAETRLGPKQAIILALLYAFNPLVILDSSAWGQIDSILALILVACFWKAYQGKLWQAALIYGVGLLVKPQVLLFGPVMLAALIVACRNAGGFGKGATLFLKTIGAGLAGFVIPALPFWIVQGDPMWLINIYVNATSTYHSATINAANLLAFLGGNWVEDSQGVLGLTYAQIGYAGMTLVCLFVMIWMIFRDKTNRTVFLWAGVLITGLFALGLRMHERYMFPALALFLLHYALERDRRALYLFGVFSITQFINVAIVLANEHLPQDVIQLGDWLRIANPDGPATYWVFLLSLIVVGGFGYAAWAAHMARRPLLWQTAGGPGLPLPEETAAPHGSTAHLSPELLTQAEDGQAEESPAGDEEDGSEPEETNQAHAERKKMNRERIRDDLMAPAEHARIPMKKKDWLIMGILTLVYAVVSLTYLGTTKVPQNMWTAMNTGDHAVIDFGQTREIAEIWHYDSLTRGNLTISSSSDGVNWVDQTELIHKKDNNENDLGIYRWTITTINFSARYVKLTVTAPPVRLLEMVFKDLDGNQITRLSVSSSGGGDKAVATAANIIDEQQMTPDRPSILNGTYFDEIYHARTGWEFTEAFKASEDYRPPVPYENTHPPLGKDLIALGISIFGMNPFGWRVMGTLMGILMVPAMYLFGMALFKKTRYAFIASFLMTFDFMHFVQTRISTIDSYPVLFIILTFMFMYLYVRTNFNTQKMGRGLLWLALSGVTFGLAAASKWIGLYAGAGLAVIFFYSLYRRFREYIAVRRGEVDLDEETREKVLRGFPSKVIITLLWCLLFFVIIAGAIYFASYIPFNIASGGSLSDWDNFKYAWDNQSSMLRYHSSLVDNHSMKSPWFQWPVIGKPMWFYKADYLPAGWTGGVYSTGNPLVWWPGLAALLWMAVRVFRSRKFRMMEMFLLAGFLTEFLPWVLVPRTTFIYHYFASVPFIIMATVLWIQEWEERPFSNEPNLFLQAIITLAAVLVVSILISPLLALVVAVFLVAAIMLHRQRESASLVKKDLTHIYLAAVLGLFILFYPVLSGLPVPHWYANWLKWLPSWFVNY